MAHISDERELQSVKMGTWGRVQFLLCMCFILCDTAVVVSPARMFCVAGGNKACLWKKRVSTRPSVYTKHDGTHLRLKMSKEADGGVSETPALDESPKRYGPQPHTEADFVALKRRVGMLENLVSELCGAILHSDDMSLLERNTAAMGSVYRDSSFSTFRSPAFARRRIESVLQKYHVTAKTQPHVWVNAVDNLAVNATMMAVNTTNSSKGNSTT